MPEISVIVPVYKVEQYIYRCVDSILNQTFSDFELILVDDGSPDNCGKICDEYAQKDSRIHVIHKKNGGLSDARNNGIEWSLKNSNSKWIIFIDSDDWIHPVMLEKLYEANIANATQISSCSFERTTSEEVIIDIKSINTYISSPEEFYLKNNINATIACAKLYKKDCFESDRYPVGKLHEDEFTTYKILFAYDAISIVDAPLYMYFQNENGIMLSQWNPKRLDALDAYKEQLQFFNTKQLPNIVIQQSTILLKFLTNNILSLKSSSLSYIKKIYYSLKIKIELIRLLKSTKKFNLTQSETEWHIGQILPLLTKIGSYLKKINILKRG